MRGMGWPPWPHCTVPGNCRGPRAGELLGADGGLAGRRTSSPHTHTAQRWPAHTLVSDHGTPDPNLSSEGTWCLHTPCSQPLSLSLSCCPVPRPGGSHSTGLVSGGTMYLCQDNNVLSCGAAPRPPGFPHKRPFVHRGEASSGLYRVRASRGPPGVLGMGMCGGLQHERAGGSPHGAGLTPATSTSLLPPSWALPT